MLRLKDARTLLESDYLAVEAGHGLTSDNMYHVAAVTYMPGCTAEMIDWWFGFIETTDMYKIWHPVSMAQSRARMSISPAIRFTQARFDWGRRLTVIRDRPRLFRLGRSSRKQVGIYWWPPSGARIHRRRVVQVEDILQKPSRILWLGLERFV